MSDPIPTGADPVWQPHGYMPGCAGWCACTGDRDGPNEETPWLVLLCRDPFQGLKDWLDEHSCEELATLLQAQEAR